jgi:hypothetical protein
MPWPEPASRGRPRSESTLLRDLPPTAPERAALVASASGVDFGIASGGWPPRSRAAAKLPGGDAPVSPRTSPSERDERLEPARRAASPCAPEEGTR